jgi:hypothetical protein
MNRLSRWMPLAGVLFTLLLASIFLVPQTPDVNASPAKITSFYASHRGALQAQTYLLAYAAIALVCFMAILTTRLRRMGADMLGRIAFAGSIMLAAGFAFGAATNIMLTHKSVTYDASSAKTLNLIANDSFFIAIAVGLVLMMVPTGIAILGTKSLPAWMGWVAVVAGVGAAVGWVAWIALMVTGLWSLVASVMLYQRMNAESGAAMPTGGSSTVPAQGMPQATDTRIGM